MEQAVFDLTLTYLSDPDKLSGIVGTAIERMRQVVQPFHAGLDTDAELAKLQRQEKRLLEAYEAEAISVEELRDRRGSIRGHIDRLKMTARPKPPVPNIDELVLSVVRSVGALPSITDNFERKKIVHALFSELRIKDHNIVAFRLNEDLGISDVDVRLATPFQICEPPEVLPEGMKRCKSCKEILPLGAFSPMKGQCKPCRRSRRRTA